MGKGRLAGTPIVVDNFRYRHDGGGSGSGGGGRGGGGAGAMQCLYFLTHMHADHSEGLSPEWDEGPVYCSAVTAALVTRKFQLRPGILQPLSLDVPHVIPLDPEGAVSVTVTLIDANHCPGAVMLLLAGYFGTLLHTGDCRFSPAMLRHPALRVVCSPAAPSELELERGTAPRLAVTAPPLSAAPRDDIDRIGRSVASTYPYAAAAAAAASSSAGGASRRRRPAGVEVHVNRLEDAPPPIDGGDDDDDDDDDDAGDGADKAPDARAVHSRVPASRQRGEAPEADVDAVTHAGWRGTSGSGDGGGVASRRGMADALLAAAADNIEALDASVGNATDSSMWHEHSAGGVATVPVTCADDGEGGGSEDVDAALALFARAYRLGSGIDRLYLDNSFCHPVFDFPSQADGVAAAAALVAAHPHHIILLAIDSLGKEDFLVALTAATSERILVPPDRLGAMALLQNAGVEAAIRDGDFTTDGRTARLRVMPRHAVKPAMLRRWNARADAARAEWLARQTAAVEGVVAAQMCDGAAVQVASNDTVPAEGGSGGGGGGAAVMGAVPLRTSHRLQIPLSGRDWERCAPVIAIFPTGWAALGSGHGPEAADAAAGGDGEAGGAADRRVEADTHHQLMYKVPYSLHSSFPEMLALVSAVRPRAIVPTSDVTHAAMCRLFHAMATFMAAEPPVAAALPPALATAGARAVSTWRASLATRRLRASSLVSAHLSGGGGAPAAPDSPPAGTIVHHEWAGLPTSFASVAPPLPPAAEATAAAAASVAAATASGSLHRVAASTMLHGAAAARLAKRNRSMFGSLRGGGGGAVDPTAPTPTATAAAAIAAAAAAAVVTQPASLPDTDLLLLLHAAPCVPASLPLADAPPPAAAAAAPPLDAENTPPTPPPAPAPSPKRLCVGATKAATALAPPVVPAVPAAPVRASAVMLFAADDDEGEDDAE